MLDTSSPKFTWVCTDRKQQEYLVSLKEDTANMPLEFGEFPPNRLALSYKLTRKGAPEIARTAPDPCFRSSWKENEGHDSIIGLNHVKWNKDKIQILLTARIIAETAPQIGYNILLTSWFCTTNHGFGSQES